MAPIECTARPETIEATLPHWELVAKEPTPALTSLVRGYWGYAERTLGPLRRHELPTADIVLIINLDDSLRLVQPDGDLVTIDSGQGFVAGLHTGYTVTETTGSQAGLELRLSPLGAYRLFQRPMQSLSNRSVDLRDIDAPWMIALTRRLQEEPSWTCRFAACDAALQDQFASMPQLSPEMTWAWRQLHRSGGRVAIATLCEELGWSPKRLIARFREQIGLLPKEASRLIRFQQVAANISGNACSDWDTFALQHGYFDQSHLIHECRRFAGDTPQGLRQRLLGPGSGFAAN